MLFKSLLDLEHGTKHILFVNNQTVGLAPKLSWRILYNNHKNKMADASVQYQISRQHTFGLREGLTIFVSAGIRSPHASERAAFHRLMTVLICSWYLFGRRGAVTLLRRCSPVTY